MDDAERGRTDELDKQILNAIKHPDPSHSMEESRERIYDEVKQKINSDPFVIRSRRKIYARYISIASVITLLIASVCTFTYRIGYHSAFHQIAQTNMEIQALPGMKSCLTLPDGTEVTLNGGSKLIYPVSFVGERHVTLSGEGFFNVAKDHDKPFFVHSEHLSVKVLGTRFNLKAYSDDRQTLLTLQTGSVMACSNDCEKGNCIFLKPDQQLIVDNATKQFQCINVSAEKFTSWKDNILIFQNQTMQEITVILERHFGTKINVVSEKIGEEQYTAQFKYGESLDEILRKLSYNRTWKFERCYNHIEIKSTN